MVEFALVGIGLVFVLICIFEMARGMWIYHTLAHTSKEATRYLIVHGEECQKRANCLTEATQGALAQRIQYHGVGLLPNSLEIQAYVGGSGNQVIGSGGGYVTVSSLSGSATTWAAPAQKNTSVEVALRYPFRSALALLWPRSGRVTFTMVQLGASSWDTIQF
ncbi:MAG: pilus assembly protein [Acidobacteria bacterium]|nr:pilus assembly protein [Acidobacteriota bacterium]